MPSKKLGLEIPVTLSAARIARTVGGLLAVTLMATTLSAPAQALPGPDDGGPAELLRYVGEPSSATGAALSSGSCDVNGDELDDGVVGAWFWDKGATSNIGAAYVLLGNEAAKGSGLINPSDANAVRIDGPSTANAFVGFAVACLGDVNDDGFDDIAISHYTDQKTYVVFGAENFTGVTLDSLGDRGFVVKGNASSGNVGFSLAPVGDLDDDGKADFGVAEVAADTQGRNNNGRVWVVAGRDDISDVDLTNPTAGQILLTVDGASSEERLGNVAKVGDVNGDGLDDFLLGGYTATPWGSSIAVPGAAYVVFGGNTGVVDAAALGGKGFAVHGPKRQRDRLGISVSGTGDIDGDGKADLLIGADGVSNAATGNRNGGAAVVLGSASTRTVYTDPAAASGQTVFTCPDGETPPTCATPSRRGYWINGAANSDSTGYSVAGLGDINGDGVPDFALGAYGYDPVNPDNPPATMSGAGAVWVVFGQTSGAVQQLSGLDDASGYRIDGLKAGDRQGRQVGKIGDLDGNGTADFFAGADFASRPGAQSGEVTVALLGKLNTHAVLSGPASALPGEDATFTATVAKSAGNQTPLVLGTVAFSYDGSPIAGCESVPVAAGSASCTTSSTMESAGEVLATYSGAPALKGSESEPLPFAVAKTPSVTGLTVSDADPDPGQLVQLRAAVSTEAGEVTGGTARFEADGVGVAGCKSVPVSEGDAVCTTSWSTRSAPEVVAKFSGFGNIAASESGATTVSVGSFSQILPDKTPKITYGVKPKPFTGEVRGAQRVPTGEIRLLDGNTVVATARLSDGEYSLKPTATGIKPGSRTLTLAYQGDDHVRASERQIAVTVPKLKGDISQKLSTSKPKRNSTIVKASITVKAKGAIPSGTVEIIVGGDVVATGELDDKGRLKIELPVFTRKGSTKVKAVFVGSDIVEADSDTDTVKVS